MRACQLLLVVVSLLLTVPARAGQYNSVLDIGDTAPAWMDLVGIDDQKHSLVDLHKNDVIVVVFTCNSCPYAVDVEDRLIELQQTYSDRGVAVVAINVNRIEADSLPAMKKKAELKNFGFAYLFDESQQIGKDYGAKYTPEFFVLDRDRRLVYMGSLDDSPDGKGVNERYVSAAIEATLDGKKPRVTETVPIGCRVRYQSARRTKKLSPDRG